MRFDFTVDYNTTRRLAKTYPKLERYAIVYNAVAHFTKLNKDFRASIPMLAKTIGLSESTTRRHLHALRDAGAIVEKGTFYQEREGRYQNTNKVCYADNLTEIPASQNDRAQPHQNDSPTPTKMEGYNIKGKVNNKKIGERVEKPLFIGNSNEQNSEPSTEGSQKRSEHLAYPRSIQEIFDEMSKFKWLTLPQNERIEVANKYLASRAQSNWKTDEGRGAPIVYWKTDFRNFINSWICS